MMEHGVGDPDQPAARAARVGDWALRLQWEVQMQEAALWAHLAGPDLVCGLQPPQPSCVAGSVYMVLCILLNRRKEPPTSRVAFC